MTRTTRHAGALGLLMAVAAAPMLIATPAGAKGGSPTVEARGSCVGGGSWKLSAKHDDRRIEVEYEVDTNRPGQLWHVVLTDNAVGIFAGQRRTVAPSGSFTVSVRPPDRPGIDTIRAHATLGARSCGGTVRL
jgi:hypothetical protein